MAAMSIGLLSRCLPDFQPLGNSVTEFDSRASLLLIRPV
jgi:hypothetical protein